MKNFMLYNTVFQGITEVDFDTNTGQQTIGEGFVEYRTTLDLSNMIGTYDLEGSTLNVGMRSTDDIIFDLVRDLSEVWTSLA